MSAKIKLNAGSGGGSFSLQAPSSSSNNRVITLPDIADGTLLTNQSSGLGKILQVVSTTKTDTTSTTSTSFVNITGLAVTITPSSASSKIYICGYVQIGINDARYSTYLRISGGNAATYIGDANTGVEVANTVRMHSANDSYSQQSSPLMFLDSPNTTNAITYQVTWASQSSQTSYLNRSYTLDADRGNTASTLTCMEVAA